MVDAVEPGGAGNPFENLTVDQRQALNDLYRCGYPRGAEFLIDPDNYTGQIFEWAWSAELIKKMDPGYFTDFWTKPGYAGHDTPHLFADDIIDTTATFQPRLDDRRPTCRRQWRPAGLRGGHRR